MRVGCGRFADVLTAVGGQGARSQARDSVISMPQWPPCVSLSTIIILTLYYYLEVKFILFVLPKMISTS